MATSRGTVRRPATPPAVRVRRSLLTLATTDPIITFYGRAVEAMKAKPITDPTSWRYQGAVHDYVPARDPFAVAGETLPSASEQSRFWSQCHHGSWFFLPWHRMYLHFFEKMIAAEVSRLGGPSNWALPYWDYGAPRAPGGPDPRLLPEVLRNPTNPDGSVNHLFVAQREANANAGRVFTRAGETDDAAALRAARYASPAGTGTFGGGHHGANPHFNGRFGAVESVPHNIMHVRIGGWMQDPAQAALDPVFWLHHCNIDRIWSEWLRGAGHTNPTDARWLRGTRFPFRDENGADVTMTCQDVVDTRAAPLSYRYDDEP